MHPAKPRQQSRQPRPVLFAERREFQPQPRSRFCMPHHGVRPDLPFFYKKMQSSQHPRVPGQRRFQEQASHAHVSNL
jgi:hypothetical protein